MTDGFEQQYSVILRNVSKVIQNQQVCKDVTLSVKKGEFFSLIGPSGCGKTSTLRMIAGFEQPTSGELYIENVYANQIPVNQRNVNLVFQNYALFPHLTVYENIAFGLKMEKTPASQIRQRVEEVLSLVQLDQMSQRYPKQLSGGQQQRVALARAIITHPAVLLLDEPLAALDFKLRQEMQAELKRLQRKLNITFIFVTHDQDEAFACSDRVAVMHKGEVHQVGTPREIYERPATRFVAEFIGDCNFFQAVTTTTSRGTEMFFPELGYTRLSDSSPESSKHLMNQSVLLAIRPERIKIVSPAKENCMTGVIKDVSFLGKETLLVIAVNSQKLVKVVSYQSLDYREGDTVGLELEDAQFLQV